ncbi:MAG: hypothetical protein WCO50_00500 [Synechococcus sp. ELA619]
MAAAGGEVDLGSAVLRLYGDRSALDKELEKLRRYTELLEKQGIKVKFDAETGQATREVNELQNKLQGLRGVLDTVRGGLRGDGQAWQGLAQGLSRAATAAEGGTGAFAGMAGGLGKMAGIAGVAIPLLGEIGLAAMGLKAIFDGVSAAVQGIIQPLEQLSAQAGLFNKQVAEGSIFAAQSFAVIGPDGKAIEGTANQMRVLRGRITAEFRAIQKEVSQISGATSTEVYEAFNIISQYSSGLGKSGENLENISKLSTRIAAAMSTLNIPGYQLRSETMSLLTGNVQQFDQLGVKLYGQGAGEKIRQLQSEGKYYDDLMVKLNKLYDGQKVLAASLENVKSNFQDVFESINAAGGQSFERGLARSFQAVLAPLAQLKDSFADMMRSVGESLEPFLVLAGLLTAQLVPVLSVVASLVQMSSDGLSVLGNQIATSITPYMQVLVGVLTVIAKSFQLMAAQLSALLRPLSVFLRVMGQGNQQAYATPFDAINDALDKSIAKTERLSAIIAIPFVKAAQAAAYLQGKVTGQSDEQIRSRQADIQSEFDNSVGATGQIGLRSINLSPLAQKQIAETEKRYGGDVPEERQLALAKEAADLKERQWKNEINALEQGVKIMVAQKALMEQMFSLAEARRGLETKRADFSVQLAASPEVKQAAEDRKNELAGAQEQQRIKERVASIQSEKAIQQQQLEIQIRQAAIQFEQLKISRAEIDIQRLKTRMVMDELYAKSQNAAKNSPEQKALLANWSIQRDVLFLYRQQMEMMDRAVALGSQGESTLRRTGALQQQGLDIQQQVLGVQAQSANMTLQQQRVMSQLAKQEQAIKNDLAERTRLESNLIKDRQQEIANLQRQLDAQQKLQAIEKSRNELAKARLDASTKEAERTLSLAKSQANARNNPTSVEAVIGAQIEAIALGRKGYVSEADAVRNLYEQKARQLRQEQLVARQQLEQQQQREQSEQRIALLRLKVSQGEAAVTLMQLEAAGKQLRLQGTRDQMSAAAGGAVGMPGTLPGAPSAPILPGPGGGGAQQRTMQLLRQFEGYRSTPYWDVNAYRVGYGTDTTTDASGRVARVTPSTRVDRAGAERDLLRRSGEFLSTVQRQIGAVFNSLSEGAKAALGSVAYNYGSLPSSVVRAAKTGNVGSISTAIRGLEGDNNGINASRRRQEAAIALGGGSASSASGTSTGTAVSLDTSLKENKDALDRAREVVVTAAAAVREMEQVLKPGLGELQGNELSRLQVDQAEQARAADVERRIAVARAEALSTPKAQLAAGLTETTVGGFGGAVRAGLSAAMNGGDVRQAVAQVLSSAAERAAQITLDAVLKPLEQMLTDILFKNLSSIDLMAIDKQISAENQLTATTQARAATMFDQAVNLFANSLASSGGGMDYGGSSGGSFGLGSLFGGGGGGGLFDWAGASGGIDWGGGFGVGGGMFDFTGPLLGARMGGILTPGGMIPLPAYAKGGVSTGPRTGYPAMLHGTEAVIPMPGGKALPVELQGGGDGGGVGPVTVNVDAKGTSVEGDQDKSSRLGKLIGDGVMGILLREKRPGGVLYDGGRQ